METKNIRPWGYYQVLSDEADHKVKRIVVAPGGCLSLQRHAQRSEHWYCVSGKGTVTLDERRFDLHQTMTADIPRGAAHRLENTSDGDLVIIEVQTGTYFGEDDIERIEDRYGRV
ncbi:MAG TPA: phosphomannose isomerase type II C-terminal cupin domain [Smithellaceae bacterium]|nr:phosphomannose isomerase type II C-terminal cupin domain [Smithellaceae bacterium]